MHINRTALLGDTTGRIKEFKNDKKGQKNFQVKEIPSETAIKKHEKLCISPTEHNYYFKS